MVTASKTLLLKKRFDFFWEIGKLKDFGKMVEMDSSL